MDFNKAIGSNKPAGGLEAFDTTEAAPEYSPVPPGIYQAKVVSGEFTTTRRGDDAYRVRFEIIEGEHADKTVVRIWTFTPKALPYAKRDLAEFGLTNSAALLAPFPAPGTEVRCRIVVALQVGDDGTERNDLKRFDQIEFRDTPQKQYLLPPSPPAEEQSEGGTTPDTMFPSSSSLPD